ncbi:MAG: PAS domain-containing protein, partial [Planctomycetota bacterium]
LEQELGATKNYLQVTVEDLEAANEELQSANEELQSANEELQSTNEELETSKEELQSTNEELGTVNDELQTRMRDLGEVNDDLQNLLRGTDVALVIVGLDLRIRRYTHQAEALFGLGEQDLGRSITHLKTLVSSPTLESVVRDVIEHVSPRAEEVRASNDHWYEMRVIPYQTQDRSIRGAVITFEDIDVIKWRVELSHEAHSLALNRVASSSEAILILNRHRRVLWANGVLYEKFGLTKSDVVGHIFPDLAAEKFGAAAVTTAIERVVNEGAMVSSIPLPQDGAGPYMLTASRFPGEVSLGPRIEVAIRGGGDPK